MAGLFEKDTLMMTIVSTLAVLLTFAATRAGIVGPKNFFKRTYSVCKDEVDNNKPIKINDKIYKLKLDSDSE